MLGQIERGIQPDGGDPVEDRHRVSGLLLQLYRADPGSDGETLYRIADDIRQQPAGEGMQVAPLFPMKAGSVSSCSS